MTRRTFLQEIQRLQDAVMALGDLVANNLLDSVEILRRRDFEASRRMIAADRQVNERRIELEMACLTLLARQQPMAGDLRAIAAILALVIELERMNDYAKGIARINLMIGEAPLIKPLIDIPAMAEKAADMLQRSLQAYAARDADLARSIPLEDDVVDELYNQVFRELMDMVIEDPTVVDQANFLLWAAHNLERAADRVTNICERVIYLVTGEMIELNEEEGLAAVA